MRPGLSWVRPPALTSTASSGRILITPLSFVILCGPTWAAIGVDAASNRSSLAPVLTIVKYAVAVFAVAAVARAKGCSIAMVAAGGVVCAIAQAAGAPASARARKTTARFMVRSPVISNVGAATLAWRDLTSSAARPAIRQRRRRQDRGVAMNDGATPIRSTFTDPTAAATPRAPDAGGVELHRIVVVGGGAGGLELATRLGRRLGKRKRAWITLLDRGRTHIWKPLLHEVASGTMDRNAEAVAYMAQARWHHFRYRIGAMDGLDRANRRIFVPPTFDEDGNEVTPRHVIEYDTLIIAVGSVANYFNTPGAAEHAIALDTEEQAARFHRRMVNACLRANAQTAPLRPGQLHCVIVGAGATGVELAAELHKSMRELAAFGLDRLDFDKSIRLTIIEAGPRILPALPERLSAAAAELLGGLGVAIRGETRGSALSGGVVTL